MKLLASLILFSSLENFAPFLIKIDIFPVCNSTHLAPIFFEISIFLILKLSAYKKVVEKKTFETDLF